MAGLVPAIYDTSATTAGCANKLEREKGRTGAPI
jgi:hypothetical protein